MECVLCQYFLGVDAFYEVITYAYEHLPANSMILKAMIHSHCRLFNAESEDYINDEKNNRSKLPHDFLIGVMVRYMDITKEGASKDPILSDFHKHSCEKDTSACRLAYKSLDDDIDEKYMRNI